MPDPQPAPSTLGRNAAAPRWAWGLLALLTLTLFALRVTGPPNLIDNDQERPASYVLDVLRHGHWLCQRDWLGDIMSKPPLFTWLAAAAAWPAGRLTYATLYFPCLVAALALAWLLLGAGAPTFGWRAGLLAGVMILASPAGVKHIALARTDALFTATIALAAVCAYRAWTRQRGWTWFWLGAALATLTKGPLGLLLAALGLLAAVWEWRGGTPAPLRGSPGAGVGLFALLVGGWFALAWAENGQPFIDKLLKRELAGHVVAKYYGSFGSGFWETPFYWLTRFLPWSLVALAGLWRVWRRPALAEGERRFERFLACWLVGGLFVFALGTHQRGDLVLPLFPPAALLAGRELARWMARWSTRDFAWRVSGVTAFCFAAYAVYLHTAYARETPIVRTRGLATLADTLRARAGPAPRVLHVDAPFTLQFYLNTMERTVSFAEAAARLRSAEPTRVAVRDLRALQDALGLNPPVLHDVAAWPESGTPFVRIVSNQPVGAGQPPTRPPPE